MIYVIQRDDCATFRVCDDLDPLYAKAFLRARQRGVENFAVKCRVSPRQITPDGLIMMDEPAFADL